MKRLALPILCAVALGMAAPALAQTPMDPLDQRDAKRLDRMEQLLRELRAIVFQGRDSGKPVVVQPAETDYQLQELTRKLADIEQSMTRMNGQLETNAHDITELRRQVDGLKQANKELGDRLAAAQAQQSAAAASPAVDAAAAGPAPPLAGAAPASAGAGETFRAAQQLMLNGDYPGAEAGFADYVTRFGEGPRGPEARYWLGKTRSAQGAYAQAAEAYIGAIRGWPKTGWAPDAVAELARALVQLKKPADACQALAELAKRYPKPPPAVAARAASVRGQAKCAA